MLKKIRLYVIAGEEEEYRLEMESRGALIRVDVNEFGVNASATASMTLAGAKRFLRAMEVAVALYEQGSDYLKRVPLDDIEIVR